MTQSNRINDVCKAVGVKCIGLAEFVEALTGMKEAIAKDARLYETRFPDGEWAWDTQGKKKVLVVAMLPDSLNFPFYQVVILEDDRRVVLPGSAISWGFLDPNGPHEEE